MPLRLDQEKDPEVLRQAARLLERENQRLTQKVVELTQQLLQLKGKSSSQLELELAKLQRQLDEARRKLFGATSERRPSAAAAESPPEKKPQRGHGRREQPQLPIQELLHPLPDSDEPCPLCGKPVLPWPNQYEDSEEIHVVRRQFVVVKHHRQKGRCDCGGCVRTAPAPLKLFPGARYSIDFAIEVATQKFDFHMPLTRQVREMAAQGLAVTSQTLWDYTDKLAHLLVPAYQRLQPTCFADPVVFIDETHWKLLMGEQERARRFADDNTRPDIKNKTWQVWTLVGRNAIYYRIQGSRDLDAGRNMLEGYCGVAMCDGYKVYTSLAQQWPQLLLAHCWAHARREYVKIEADYRDDVARILDLIGELFAIEATVPAGDSAEHLAARAAVRAERSTKVIDAIACWCREVQTFPESTLATAIKYTTNHWTGLTRFLSDPRIPLENNTAERANRSPVVGRKNHYGSRSRRGTEVAAILSKRQSYAGSTRSSTCASRRMPRYAVSRSRCRTNCASARHRSRSLPTDCDAIEQVNGATVAAPREHGHG